MDKIRWGILGTGRIANDFAVGLSHLPDAELVAVGSRTQETADTFGAKYHILHRHASYEAMASDPGVDAIYVSTPHPMHKANSLLCLMGGKAVICEKPFTINAAEAAELITYARQHNLFLLEAMWTRFLPVMAKVRELLSRKAIGDVRAVTADFGFRTNFNPQSRLFAPALGGGALLDVGVYVISFASMVLGPKPPVRVVSLAQLGETGVDEQGSYVLDYGNGVLANLFAAVRTQSAQEAVILGTEGRIRIHSQFYHATRITLTQYGKEDRTIETPFEGNGFNYEAAELMRCLRAGKTESDILPLDETLAVLQTMDQIRKPWGLRYPTEQ
ncbi:MAG: Gfo/Idh/MocA family oxidoreductase [Chloroflexi bacterium]|nr:Gfo/Idh/MocA family oxidoreductase [Chloroflexota bacterium]MCL5273609.1 Gfo/Idh/MocA family oxidoreductase [Chloroflexota bacterium]